MRHWIHEYCGTQYMGPIRPGNQPPLCPVCHQGDETIYENHDFYETGAGQEILNAMNLQVKFEPFNDREDKLDLYSELLKGV